MDRKTYRKKLADTVVEAVKRAHKLAPEFLDLLLRKNADYNSDEENVFSNFEESADIAGIDGAERVLISRLAEKFQRVRSLINSDQPPQVADELLVDTILDIAGYSVIGIIMLQWYGEKNDSALPS
jgi:hypothetical protein